MKRTPPSWGSTLFKSIDAETAAVRLRAIVLFRGIHTLERLDTRSPLRLAGFVSVIDLPIRSLHIWPRILTTIDGRSDLVGRAGFGMLKHLKGPTAGLSSLGGEEFQVAVRLAHNDLHYSKKCFDEFVSEAAPLRILQYSYLHLLFAHMIVSELNKESDRRCRSASKHADS